MNELVLDAFKELTDNKAVIEICNPQKRQNLGTGTSTMIGKAANALAGELNNSVNTLLGGQDNENSIKAQYNPNSIKYTATAQENTKSEVEDNIEIKNVTAHCTISMTVDLVFHSRYELDDSVEKQMGRMLDFMMRGKGRNARFYWSNMVLEGQIESFSSEYNMFDCFGNPIGGTMNLTIRSKSTIKSTAKMYMAITQERPEQPVADILETQ